MIMVDAADASNKSGRDRLKKYRYKIEDAARKEAKLVNWVKLEEGADLFVELVYARPVSHLRKDLTLRKGKPIHKQSKPDLDKLLRAINDALGEAEIFGDDSQVVSVRISKRYAKPEEVHGIVIEVRPSALGLAGLL